MNREDLDFLYNLFDYDVDEPQFFQFRHREGSHLLTLTIKYERIDNG